MVEVIVAMDAGSKRRLPSWMGRNDTARLGESGNIDERSSIAMQCEPKGCGSMAESMASETDKILGKRRMLSEKSENILKNSSHENSGKVKRGGGLNDSRHNCGRTKKKFKEKSVGCELTVSMPSSSEQKMKLKRAKSNNGKNLPQEMTKDEVELTIEDLISLANECLTKEPPPPKPSVSRKTERISNSAASSVSSATQRTKLGEAIRSCQELTKSAQSSSFETCVKQTEGPAASSASHKIIHAGDPAQEMLELFLGPLLKKASPEEEEQVTTTELLSSGYESVGSGRGVDEGLCLVKKKKSSLKDKVALFFN